MEDFPINMTSQAVHDFCNAAREAEALRAQRKLNTRYATEAKKTAEQILIETLGAGAKAQIEVDGDVYLVRVASRELYPTCGSNIVDAMGALWDDPDILRGKIEDSRHDNIVDACTAILFDQAGITPRNKCTLQVAPLKEGKNSANIEGMQGAHADVASALIRANTELTRGREEHRETLKQCHERGQEAETNIIQELSQLDSGQVKRVNMVDPDGTSTSYYLRLKKTRPPPKRKITVKTLQTHIKEVLNKTLNPLLIDESLKTFCSNTYAQHFILELKEALQKHEKEAKPQSTARMQTYRVALDKLRGSKNKVEASDYI